MLVTCVTCPVSPCQVSHCRWSPHPALDRRRLVAGRAGPRRHRPLLRCTVTPAYTALALSTLHYSVTLHYGASTQIGGRIIPSTTVFVSGLLDYWSACQLVDCKSMRPPVGSFSRQASIMHKCGHRGTVEHNAQAGLLHIGIFSA